MGVLRRTARPVRVHIDLSQHGQMRYWTRHLSVSPDDLQKAIDKVGNSAAAVRKQLALSRQSDVTPGQ